MYGVQNQMSASPQLVASTISTGQQFPNSTAPSSTSLFGHFSIQNPNIYHSFGNQLVFAQSGANTFPPEAVPQTPLSPSSTNSSSGGSPTPSSPISVRVDCFLSYELQLNESLQENNKREKKSQF